MELDDNRRFLQQTEQAIRETNNDVIHKKIPPLTTARMLSFANAVANLRADYFEAAFTFTDSETHDPAAVEQLAQHRQAFEESRDAFIALQRAIELGYMAVEID